MSYIGAPGHRSLVPLIATAIALLCPGRAGAATLPGTLAPPPPFPLVLASSLEREPVAPGVARATYRLMTSAGPLVVSIVTVDLNDPTVRLGTVLAHDRVVSSDETVSSMARRTGAVAGINGDYFDIGATGAPTGVLVSNGLLDRSPNERAALTVTRDRAVRFDTYRFAGTATSGVVQVPITALNVWPPQAGATLLTPSYGPIPADGTANVTVLDLQPMPSDGSGTPRYRVNAESSVPPYPGAGDLRLAYGPAALGFGPVPDISDVVTLNYDTAPSVSDVAAAIGGGPMLLEGGAPVDDPSSPNYADRDRRIPAAAAARLTDGTLALVVADGRHPATSIGVNRAELIALLQTLGATDAMLFDSGGSATLVARVLGDAGPSVLNDPSDGVERPVADGLFVYSDAPVGPPSQLVVRPAQIEALAGATIALRARLVDAADHGLGPADGPWQLGAPPQVASVDGEDVLHVGRQTGTYDVHVTRNGVRTQLPLTIVDRVARVTVGPPRANPAPHGSVPLTVAAFDRQDRPVAVGGLVRWSAQGGTVDPDGVLSVGDRDAVVTASVGGATASVTVPVGQHTAPLALNDPKLRPAWRYVTAPTAGLGALNVVGGRLRVSYDFTAGGRAAYALPTPELPLGEPLGLSCTVDGDANGEALRANLVDRYGDHGIVTFARAIDFTGRRRLHVRVPAALAPPVALHSLYVVGTLAHPPIAAAGTIGVGECTVTLAGAPSATMPTAPGR
ncbi:MAG TPA: phosphodiester glycosidase family protein [Candidatus Limnocylindria bacterium]|nr:phosphodiester glycosidase family protein [Candidatus Limnocylindria bacterium]